MADRLLLLLIMQCPKEHVHVLIQDQQFLAYGGSYDTPAALVRRQWSELGQNVQPLQNHTALLASGFLQSTLLLGWITVQVTVEASQRQITEDARKAVVDKVVSLLKVSRSPCRPCSPVALREAAGVT